MDESHFDIPYKFWHCEYKIYVRVWVDMKHYKNNQLVIS
jgi:hypothetical protein